MGKCQEKLSAAIVGTGRIGWMLELDPLRGKPCTHAGALADIPGVRIMAAADPDARRLRSFGRRFKVRSLYRDYRELLDKNEVDILTVAAPTPLHCRIVTEAASSGKVRGIYCEKPISRTLEEAERMIEACKRAGVALVIGHERRFGAHFLKARELVREGVIGEVRTLIGQALSSDPGLVSREEAGGGPLLHDGTHLTDLFGYFCGPAEWVIGLVRRGHGPRNIEHTALALVGMECGAFGFIEGGGRRGYFAFDLEIQGSEGVLRVGNSPPQLSLSRSSKRLDGFRELEQVEFPSYIPNNGFIAAFEALIEEIRSGVPSISSGRDGRAALEIILAVYESAAKGGKRVRLGK
jgi:predicted dehydrogenase